MDVVDQAAERMVLPRRIVDAAGLANCDYAVFVGRSVEYVPVSGKRFARLVRDPMRAAQLVGTFGPKSSVEDVAAAIAREL